jgi:glucose-1-phosphate thymidylyltransferase
MIYYPLTTLMLANIRDILIISTPEDTPRFEELLGDGHQFGIRLSYAVQPSPDGLAQAFLIGEDFIGGEPCAMILGDNIFYGNGLGSMVKCAAKRASGGTASVFGFYVDDPERYGVVDFDCQGRAISLEEKPEHPKSNYAVTGLYFYPAGVSELAKQVKPSARGELEITSLNRMYLEQDRLDCKVMGRGFSWLDTGTMDSLMTAANFIQTIQNLQGIIVSAPEEVAYRYRMITKEELVEAAKRYGNSSYGKHLMAVADGRVRL